MKEEMSCGHCHMWGKSFYMVVGVLAFVYGLVMWARMTYAWPPYAGWMVGGVLLVVVGWLKKWFYMKKS